MFGVPLEQKIEIIHPHDAALTFVHAINNKRAFNQIFIGGGGTNCQIYQREYVNQLLKSSGIGVLPEYAFKKALKQEDWFYTYWMDTVKSQ